MRKPWSKFDAPRADDDKVAPDAWTKCNACGCSLEDARAVRAHKPKCIGVLLWDYKLDKRKDIDANVKAASGRTARLG